MDKKGGYKLIHRCAQCDEKWDCGYGNPCSSHDELLWCSDKCKEAWFDDIFQANLEEGLKNE